MRSRVRLLAPLCAAALLVPLSAGGQGASPPVVDTPQLDPDFERALGAVQRGEIKRLSDILPGIEAEFGGRAIETEIETDDGRWVYEIEILTADGRLFEVDVDAVTGEVIDVEEEVD
ncbi:PepSY domain-containing protein [Amaricoccus sp.]|uniref:PepSY domain-containing protein n=1 Tax=Amaricoccus sp. TaxID=1872485 RepID=UPI001B40662A|nr:PepSY domain-containing protein [Amaricoccus sp.]MBP7241396.1 PepSY domain-containing protein [Amaricoccus sp.]